MAKQFLEKSISSYPTQETQELFKKVNQEIIKKQRILELKQIISQEEQYRIYNEELEKQKNYLHKFGLIKIGTLHHTIAKVEMEKRLLNYSHILLK